MYNERKDEFSIRGLLLQVLFVIVFVFLLMWIFPTKKQIEKLIDVPVYDNVFNQNMHRQSIKLLRDYVDSYNKLKDLIEE